MANKKYENKFESIRLPLLIATSIIGLAAVVFEFGKQAQNLNILELNYRNLEIETSQVRAQTQKNTGALTELADTTSSHVQQFHDGMSRLDAMVKLNYDRLTRTNDRLNKLKDKTEETDKKCLR